MSNAGARVRELVDTLAPSRRDLEASAERVLASQIAITEISAPTGSESRRAAWIARRFSDAGLAHVSIDDAGNVIGSRRGRRDDAPVVVCAHLDTVFAGREPIFVRRVGTRLMAPGIGDNARGLAAMLALVGEFGTRGRLDPERPIIFAATTGEEGAGDLRGARHLFATAGSGAHAAIAIDGAGDERVVTSALGSRRYRVEFRGPGGHSWAAYGVPNAVHAAAALGARLASLPLPDQPRSTLTVARIGGGSAVNAIPGNAWLEIDVRSRSAAQLVRLDHEVHLAVEAALAGENARRRAGTAPLAAEIRSLGDRPAGDVGGNEDVVLAALEATRCVGRAPELAVASTDANIPISLGIPAVAIGGGGRGGDTHTSEEWYEDTQGARGVVRALLVVAAMAGMPA